MAHGDHTSCCPLFLVTLRQEHSTSLSFLLASLLPCLSPSICLSLPPSLVSHFSFPPLHSFLSPLSLFPSLSLLPSSCLLILLTVPPSSYLLSLFPSFFMKKLRMSLCGYRTGSVPVLDRILSCVCSCYKSYFWY